jgi:hypothetical protein
MSVVEILGCVVVAAAFSFPMLLLRNCYIS